MAGVERDLGGRPEKNSSHHGTSYQEIFKNVGLGHSVAHRWQKLNSIPEKKFEGSLAEFKAEVELLSMAAEADRKKLITVGNELSENLVGAIRERFSC